MKRLLYQEWQGGRLYKWWHHYGPDGQDQLTVETTEDAEKTFKRVNALKEKKRKDFKYLGSVPRTLIDEMCRLKAVEWGIPEGDVFRELMENKTDRAQGVWRVLTTGRDYRKLQCH